MKRNKKALLAPLTAPFMAAALAALVLGSCGTSGSAAPTPVAGLEEVQQHPASIQAVLDSGQFPTDQYFRGVGYSSLPMMAQQAAITMAQGQIVTAMEATVRAGAGAAAAQAGGDSAAVQQAAVEGFSRSVLQGSRIERTAATADGRTWALVVVSRADVNRSMEQELALLGIPGPAIQGMLSGMEAGATQ